VNPIRLENFSAAWVLDSEYRPVTGSGVDPVSIAGVDLLSGRAVSLWADNGPCSMPPPAWAADPDAVHLAFNWSAEASFYVALGWRLPTNAIDLMVEFMLFRNAALPKRVKDDLPGFVGGWSLLTAAKYFGIPLDPHAERHKERMRDRILNGRDYGDQDRQDIQNYGQDDVRLAGEVFKALDRAGHFAGDQLAAALRRGCSVLDGAVEKARGVPIDVEIADRLNRVMTEGYAPLVRRFDPDGLFIEDTTLKQTRIGAYAAHHQIAWDRTPTGRFSTADKTLARLEKHDPKLGDLRTLMGIRNDLRGFDLEWGPDGRLRYDPRPFWSNTGRSQPAGDKTVFGKNSYLRGLVVAPAGRCLVYGDYHAEEIGIAAYLSGDPKMIELYESPDDIYLRFGAMSGLVPEHAVTDPDRYKTYRNKILKRLLLGTQYGMQESTFSSRAGIPLSEAQRLIRAHRCLFSRFWPWAESNQEQFRVYGRLYTPMRDWFVRWHPLAKSTTLLNWPMQAGAGDILRRAVRKLHRAGVCVLTTLHDAVLVECDLADVKECERVVVRCMEEASREVLGGHTIRAEVAIRVTAGRRLFEDNDDGRKQETEWDRLLALLNIRSGRCS
jgi:hypothetical protein